MITKQIKVGPMENFSYLVACEKTHKGCVIDPAWEVEKILKTAQKNNIEIIYIINTHRHHDHTNGNQEIIKKSHGKLIAHKACSPHIFPRPDIEVTDQDVLELGEIYLKILHTPGHSAGSISILAKKNLFTGDTLFMDAVGRTDLASGDPYQLKESLKIIKQLPDDIIIYPGHHYGEDTSNTLKRVKEINFFLR